MPSHLFQIAHVEALAALLAPLEMFGFVNRLSANGTADDTGLLQILEDHPKLVR